MKCIVVCVLLFSYANAQYSAGPCSTSDPNVTDCLATQFTLGRIIPLDKIDPLEARDVTIDQSVNDLVWIRGKVTNSRLRGYNNVIVENFKFDPVNLTADVRFTLPSASWEFEYEVGGQILIIPLQSRGFFNGDFTDVSIFARGFFTKVSNNGQEAYKLDKLQYQSKVGYGQVKMISSNPDLQFGADLMANFFNQNPKQVMDAINPIYTTRTASWLQDYINDFLLKIPASDILIE